MRRILLLAAILFLASNIKAARAAAENIDLKHLAGELAKGENAHALAQKLGAKFESNNHGYNVMPDDRRFEYIGVERDDRGFVEPKTAKKEKDMLTEYVQFNVAAAAQISLAEIKAIFPGEWKFLPPNPDEFLTIYSFEYDSGAKYKVSVFVKYPFADKNGDRLKEITLRVDPRLNSRW